MSEAPVNPPVHAHAAVESLGGGLATPWDEALLAVTLFAVDPVGCGGIRLHSMAGPVRDRWLAYLAASLPDDQPPRRIPIGISDDRLLGGLDLPATLKAGKPVARIGLLAESDGGVLLLSMAERVEPNVAARLAATLDTGEVLAEREGLTFRSPARLGIVALDESGEGDDPVAEGLSDRLAFQLDLRAISHRDAPESEPDADEIRAARALVSQVRVSDEQVQAAVLTAVSLGIASLRAPMQVLKVARCAAALDGRTEVDSDDMVAAVRMVLGPRATRIPEPPPPEEDEEDEPPPPPEDEPPPEEPEQQDDPPSLEDILLEAAKAAIPPGLLAQLQSAERQRRQSRAGKAGANAPTKGRGRPIGVRAGALRPGVRLNLIATLRTAAPWQTVRRRSLEANLTSGRELPPIMVRPEDFRITRFRKRKPTTTIFVVDASGSAAMARLAEAKGAVELLLAESYVRRDHVALVSFRGKEAEILLPPTRSLVRAKRSLSALPGGGGTPLAAGIHMATQVAESVSHHGETPVLVFLTDGRANVKLDGTGGRAQAHEEALRESRRILEHGFMAVMIDMGQRPDPKAAEIALAMGARYLPLPYADSRTISEAAKNAAGPLSGGAGSASGRSR
ncbi:magnesium chelatase subunit D [Phaeovibrio sulfidiphilus]|uniref:Mg-protoporphyrin IX chelatase n=1 Tax=Phaeovibrio sulfidiphilus TaxID=1220600 RepID=A0A8J7CVM7_9PROT|nr:magnesium chelatase subunit D [Phaeovibrio sulfidiphilus]MBE1236481.1 magnesium chelatase subunit D [Phaeovibrio sulfidiphilus]